MSTGKLVLGTLAGLAIGAIAGILFAPEKGSTTRRQIMNKGDDYMDDLKSKFDDFYDAVTEKMQRTKNEAEEFIDKGKAKYEEAKKDVRNATADFKQDGAAASKHTAS